MGSTAAAVIIRKEKDLVSHFRERRATSVATAKTMSELGVDTGIAWRRLTDRAVVRGAGSGTWYLDEPVWEALRRTRQRFVGLILFMVAAGFLAWFLGSRS